MKYQEIYGDLIIEAKKGAFDVIAHGCNCFCNMGAGIAVAMKKEFGADKFPLEQEFEDAVADLWEGESKYKTGNKGNINKLGQIDYKPINVIPIYKKIYGQDSPDFGGKNIYIVNCYTQYGYGNPKGDLDYEALTLCMRKINSRFAGMHIGLPQIGAGLAKGNWEKIKNIIQRELKDMNITVVIYEK